MEIFKRLLLAISSEFFSEGIIKRVKKIAKRFGSEIYFIYVIEEKTLRKFEEVAEPFLTDVQREEIEKNVIEENKAIAENIYEKLKSIDKFEISIGEFSDEVLKAAAKYNATCIIIGFEKECFLRYRLFRMAAIPILVEIGEGGKNILGICTNLAPNLRVPKYTIEIAKKFDYTPYLFYVVDVEDKVEIDERGMKREKSIEELEEKAKEFIKKYEDMAKVKIKVGVLEEAIKESAEEVNADLVIVGREMKKRKIFSKGIKMEILDKMRHSLLFLN